MLFVYLLLLFCIIKLSKSAYIVVILTVANLFCTIAYRKNLTAEDP